MRLRALWLNNKIVLYSSAFIYAATYIAVTVVTTLGAISFHGIGFCLFLFHAFLLRFSRADTNTCEQKLKTTMPLPTFELAR